MDLTYEDVLAARAGLAELLPITPMWTYPALNAVAGAELWVKHENVQPVGAFKVRGGLTLLAALPAPDRARGLVTYSTGNHAQSLAYASAHFGVACTVVMPVPTSAAKVRAVTALGATVISHGANMSEAETYARQLAADTDRYLIGPADELPLLAGVGTLYVEMLTARPDLDALVVPVGSGTGAAAAGVVARALAPTCRVIAVQSTAAPAAHDSWRAGECVRRENRTTAEGLATGRGFELPQRILRSVLSDFHLVTEEQLADARRLLASHAHTLAEAAGAASLAAVLTRPDEFAGQRVGLVCTGGNASEAEIATLAQDPRDHELTALQTA